MANEAYNQVNDAGKASYETLQQLNSINMKAFQKLSLLQYGLAKLGIEGTVEQAKLLANASNYEDLFSIESEFANEYSKKWLGLTQEMADIFIESREEMMQYFEKNLATSGSEISPAKKVQPVKTKRINKRTPAKKAV